MSDPETTKQLTQIKWLVAFGTIGFVLAGGGISYFSVVSATAMAEYAEAEETSSPCDEEDKEEKFGDKAAKLFERGALEDLSALIHEQSKEFPNDADVHWYTARLHSVRNEWTDALEALDRTQLLSPSWADEYIRPLREEIIRRRDSASE